jgi:hypothetical protein
MSIKVSVTDPQSDEEQKQIVPGAPQATVKLDMRKAVDGSVLIYDHPDIDIIIMPNKQKIVLIGGDGIELSEVYDTQNHLFRHLVKKGLVQHDSVKGGNIYGSMEGIILGSTSEDTNPIQLTIFQISKWMDQERPYFQAQRAYLEREEDRLLEPDDEDSTELGEVPHEESKGSIRPGWIRGPFGLYDMWRT